MKIKQADFNLHLETAIANCQDGIDVLVGTENPQSKEILNTTQGKLEALVAVKHAINGDTIFMSLL